MTITWRILIASRNAGIAWNSYLELERAGGWHVVGIVDPRAKIAFDTGCETADAILIEVADMLWLLDHRPTQARTAFKKSPPMVLLDEDDILEIVTNGDRTWGLLIDQRLFTMTADRLALACAGYLVLSTKLFQHLCRDGLRVDAVKTLSLEELSVLTHLGQALSNRAAAETLNISESHMKAASRALARKLHLKNKTALAVFAVDNEVMLSRLAAKLPELTGPSPRIGRNGDANG
jgi:DNA-binding CsgD family transcriptional regulator